MKIIIIWIIIQTLEILNHLFFNGASQVVTGLLLRSHATCPTVPPPTGMLLCKLAQTWIPAHH